MGTYLYCVTAPGQQPPDEPAGLEDARVTPLDVHGMRLWTSPLDRAPAASLEHVRRHNAVVEAAAAEETPLPIRFGQWFESRQDLEAAIAERADSLAAGLDRVRGALEFGVRILDLDHRAQGPDRSSGRAYLEALARRERRAEEGRVRVHRIDAEMAAFLGPLVRDRRVRAVGTETLGTIAHLVDRHDNGSYQRRVREFPARYPGLRFLFSGPWPPYEFAE